MNLPNQLTVSRFFLTIVFMVVLFIEFPFNSTVALAVFVVASITDWVDGAYARKHKLITNFGKLMDPLADKILTGSAFIAFAGLGLMPAWMVVIIVGREMAVTGLRLLAASKHLVLAADSFGKAKTIAQIVSIIATLVVVSWADWGLFGRLFGFEVYGRPWIARVDVLAQWAATLLTFLSGWLYFWHNREVYLNDM